MSRGAMGARRSGGCGERRLRARAVSAVAVAACAAMCAMGPGPAFVSGVVGGPGLPTRRGEKALRRSCGTFAMPCGETVVPWFSSDFVQQGKFRGAARLVRGAANRIAEVAPLGSVFSLCATSLRGAAAALLEEQWVDAEQLIAAARNSISDGAAMNPREALSALGETLEFRATELSEASADALEDAAGALRAAARMFVQTEKASAATRDSFRSEAYIFHAFLSDPQLVSARAAARLVAAAETREDRMKMLRLLAKQHHPDRNPGRESEVLPTFLLVQQLREEWRHSMF